jgi:hypothetical protein
MIITSPRYQFMLKNGKGDAPLPRRKKAGLQAGGWTRKEGSAPPSFALSPAQKPKTFRYIRDLKAGKSKLSDLLHILLHILLTSCTLCIIVK